VSRFCPKCGNEVSNTANVCPKCGTRLNSAKAQQTSSKRKNRSTAMYKMFSALLAVVVLGGGALYLFRNSPMNPSAESSSETSVVEQKIEETSSQVTEKKTEQTKQKKEIQYERFKDPVFGFSFDFDKAGEHPAPPKNESPGSAVTYLLSLGEQKECTIVVGSLFKGGNRPLNIEKQIKQDRSNYPSSDRYQNVDMHTIASNAYEVTYDKDDVHYTEKYYFGRVGTKDEAHYIKVGCRINQTNEDLVNEAKHIYDSFQPGVSEN